MVRSGVRLLLLRRLCAGQLNVGKGLSCALAILNKFSMKISCRN